jgi:heme exporter protein D
VSFGSFQEFLAMGGHGLYVWMSYGAALIIVLYNVLSVRLRLRRFYLQAADLERRGAARGRPRRSPAAVAAPSDRSLSDPADPADTGESVRP